MILCCFSFPSPPSALCTVFGEPGLPCPVTSLCSSLSPCPVSSPPSPFFLPWGALGGGGACCCREGVEEGAGETHPAPSFPLRREILAQGDSGGRGGGGTGGTNGEHAGGTLVLTFRRYAASSRTHRGVVPDCVQTACTAPLTCKWASAHVRPHSVLRRAGNIQSSGCAQIHPTPSPVGSHTRIARFVIPRVEEINPGNHLPNNAGETPHVNSRTHLQRKANDHRTQRMSARSRWCKEGHVVQNTLQWGEGIIQRNVSTDGPCIDLH